MPGNLKKYQILLFQKSKIPQPKINPTTIALTLLMRVKFRVTMISGSVNTKGKTAKSIDARYR